MSGSARVVPLKAPLQNPELSPTERAQLARLPAPLHSVREKGKQMLAALLRNLFDKTDDALFELADKATNNHAQNLFFESMREVRIHRRGIENRFAQAVDRAFLQLTEPALSKSTEDAYTHATLEELALVKNEDLEAMVAADSMVNRANEHYAESVQHLTLRIDHLVPLKVYQQNNPLGPQVLCRAFMDYAKGLNADIKAKLVLFKLFDKWVLSDLQAVYDTANQLMVDANILPSLKQDLKQARQTEHAAVNNGPAAREGDAEPSSAGSRTARPGLGEGVIVDETLRSLRELLAPPEEHAAQARAAAPLSSADLMALLSQLQHQQPTSQGPVILSDLLAPQVSGQVLGQIDSDVIHLVDMLFEFILEDRNLAAPMKAQLARLQIPILKVAITDNSFFSKGGHPARRLLNEMATAAVGWQADTQGKDLLYPRICTIVQRLLDEFEADTHIFADLLADFVSFIEKEQYRAAILEQRTLDAESGKARAEESRKRVSEVLDGVIGARTLPAAVSSLLRETWSNVLFLIRLKQGEETAEWRQAVQTAEDLVWSVTAPMAGDDRQRLLKLVPDLLQRLRQGLESVAHNPYDTIQLMKQLEPLHMAQLKADSPPKAAATPVKPEAPDVSPDNVMAPVMTAAPKPTETSVHSASCTQSPADEVWLRQVDKLTQGSWFEMEEPQGQAYRCRLAAILKPVSKYIFVNRSGMKVAEKSREGLAQALQQGTLRQLDDGMLFDRALESVIGDLRNSRSGSAP